MLLRRFTQLNPTVKLRMIFMDFFLISPDTFSLR